MATEVLALPGGSSSHRHLLTSLASVRLCLESAGVFRPREGRCQVAPGVVSLGRAARAVSARRPASETST